MIETSVVQVLCEDANGDRVEHGECAQHRYLLSIKCQKNRFEDPKWQFGGQVVAASGTSLEDVKVKIHEERDRVVAAMAPNDMDYDV